MTKLRKINSKLKWAVLLSMCSMHTLAMENPPIADSEQQPSPKSSPRSSFGFGKFLKKQNSQDVSSSGGASASGGAARLSEVSEAAPEGASDVAPTISRQNSSVPIQRTLTRLDSQDLSSPKNRASNVLEYLKKDIKGTVGSRPPSPKPIGVALPGYEFVGSTKKLRQIIGFNGFVFAQAETDAAHQEILQQHFNGYSVALYGGGVEKIDDQHKESNIYILHLKPETLLRARAGKEEKVSVNNVILSELQDVGRALLEIGHEGQGVRQLDLHFIAPDLEKADLGYDKYKIDTEIKDVSRRADLIVSTNRQGALSIWHPVVAKSVAVDGNLEFQATSGLYAKELYVSPGSSVTFSDSVRQLDTDPKRGAAFANVDNIVAEMSSKKAPATLRFAKGEVLAQIDGNFDVYASDHHAKSIGTEYPINSLYITQNSTFDARVNAATTNVASGASVTLNDDSDLGALSLGQGSKVDVGTSTLAVNGVQAADDSSFVVCVGGDGQCGRIVNTAEAFEDAETSEAAEATEPAEQAKPTSVEVLVGAKAPAGTSYVVAENLQIAPTVKTLNTSAPVKYSEEGGVITLLEDVDGSVEDGVDGGKASGKKRFGSAARYNAADGAYAPQSSAYANNLPTSAYGSKGANNSIDALDPASRERVMRPTVVDTGNSSKVVNRTTGARIGHLTSINNDLDDVDNNDMDLAAGSVTKVSNFNLGIWSSVAGEMGYHKDTDEMPEYENKIANATFGLDISNKGGALGVAVSGLKSKTEYTGAAKNGDTVDIKGTVFSLYGRKNIQDFFIEGVFSKGTNKVNTKTINPGHGVATSEFDQSAHSGLATVGYHSSKADKVNYLLSAGLGWKHVHNPARAETGSGADQSFDEQKSNSTFGIFTFGVDKNIRRGKAVIVPNAKFEVTVPLVEDADLVSYTIYGLPGKFSVAPNVDKQVKGSLTAGLDIKRKNFTLSFDAEYEFSKNYKSIGGVMSFRFKI